VKNANIPTLREQNNGVFKNNQKIMKYLLPGLILILASQSCKKEYVDKFKMIPADTVTLSGYTHITSFKISEFSADTIIKATIGSDSIIIYWPSYKPLPATIKPTITIPEKATILPGSGAEVNFENGTKFTVTSEAGTKKEYKLYIDFRQPEPYFVYNNPSVFLSSANNISGDWLLTDTARTKVYLISATDQKEYTATVVSMSTGNITFNIPATLPADQLYDIKVVNGIYTIYNNTVEQRNNIAVTP
jgi:hypothetical protein